jgi:hypothetical protein
VTQRVDFSANASNYDRRHGTVLALDIARELASMGVRSAPAIGTRDDDWVKTKCPIYMLSGIASGVVCSPVIWLLEHDVPSLAAAGREGCDAAGGSVRQQWREWPVLQV